MNKKKKNFVAALAFFTILITLSLLWWNVTISQAWFSRTASIHDIQGDLKGNAGSVNARDASGWTGLMIAADRGDIDRARLLLEYKADPNALSNDLNKCTALHMICRKSLMVDRNIEIMELLLAHGANIHAKDAYQREPIHWIGGISDPRYRTRVLDLLMKHGADLNAQDINGDTPLNVMIDYLWSRDPSWFIDALMKPYGDKIDPKIKNKRGETSVDFARVRKYIPIVEALCSTGKWSCTEAERTGFVE